MILKNPYDSHVHWLWTGEMQSVLQLHSLQSPSDLKKIEIKKDFFRGDWLLGFGWDQNKFSEQGFPNRFDLDKLFPDIPVSFTRIDGHAIWVNSIALKLAGIDKNTPQPQGGEILKDEQGEPTGILIDHAYELVQKLFPVPGPAEIEKFLLKGMNLFNRAGLTHIRDLSCDQQQWDIEKRLDAEDRLTIVIEQFFGAFQPEQFSEALRLAKEARELTLKNIRVKGIKIFYDGAIGSEGALLSQPYLTRPHHTGLKLLEKDVLENMIISTWNNSFEIAIHVIGDRAAEEVVRTVYDLKQKGHTGKLNLEHGELLNAETISLMKSLNISCHLQPSHWLTDKHWLEQKVGNLKKIAFPWRELEKHKIDFHFGSDCPIEQPSFFRTLEAIDDAAKNGIPPTQSEPLSYHQHPDEKWAENSFAVLEDGRVKKTVFKGKTVFENSNR